MNDKWISLGCYMYLSKLIYGYMDFLKSLHGFVWIDICFSISYYMDLSKLPHEFIKVKVPDFVKICSLYF